MGLYKRGQVWWMSFTHRGKQIKRSTEATDKKLAEKIYCKVMTQSIEGVWFDKLEGEEKTVGELLEKYINAHSIPNKRPNTVRADRIIAREMEGFFEKTALKDITPRLIADYKAFCRDKGLAPASINQRRGLLRHAFSLAMREWEWVRENPVDRVNPEKVRNARDRWLTFDEEKRLIENCVLHPTITGNKTESRFWMQEIVVFALNTGMRQDEILSLEWPHIDLFRKTATVVRSKNGEKRTIPLNQRTFELLKSKAKVRSIRSNYAFSNEAGNKIIASNVLRAFYKALERAEISDFRFHDLRHTFATRLAQAGVDFYKIGKLLGHKDIRMTQRYSHHYPESLRDGVEVLDRISTILEQSKEKGAQLTL